MVPLVRVDGSSPPREFRAEAPTPRPVEPVSDRLKVDFTSEVEPEGALKLGRCYGRVPPRLAHQVEKDERSGNVARVADAGEDDRKRLSKKLVGHASN